MDFCRPRFNRLHERAGNVIRLTRKHGDGLQDINGNFRWFMCGTVTDSAVSIMVSLYVENKRPP